VQDSCSDDGTLEWLPADRRVKTFIEKDHGMVCAVNRAATSAPRRHPGVSQLRTQQYLPRRAPAVREFFEQHPHIEVVLAGSIITDGDGNYLCHRTAPAAEPAPYLVRFPFLTSSVFIAARVIHEAPDCF